MKKTLLKESLKEIIVSRKRFVSILLIVMLGVGFFVGIKATSPDMKKTIDGYMKETNAFDVEVLSTLGITSGDIEEIERLERVESLEGAYKEEAIVKIKENEETIAINGITLDINKITLLTGNMPATNNECLVEEKLMLDNELQIGDKIHVTEESIEDFLKEKDLTIVGVVKSPLYISQSRGYARLGTGKVNYFLYVPSSNINSEEFTTLYIKIKESNALFCYSDSYKDLVKQTKDDIEEISSIRIEARYQEVMDKANEKLQQAEAKLQKEKDKATSKITEGEEEIASAKRKIEKAKKDIRKNKTKANTGFAIAEKEIEETKQKLTKEESNLSLGKKTLEEAKQKLKSLEELSSNYTEVIKNIEKINESIANIDLQISMLDKNKDLVTLNILYAEKESLQQMLSSLDANKQQLEKAATDNNVKISNIESTIAIIQKTIGESETELNEGQEKLEKAKEQLTQATKDLKNKKSSTYTQIIKGEKEIVTSQNEILKAEKKLNEAKQQADEKISDAENKIKNAKQDIKKIEKPEWYILDKEANAGYVEFMQDTERLAKIGEVFPIIFFVVAALISLTSMTRMVDEQRVQIGTLKALGYTKIQIASKYILYAFLATIIGVLIGNSIGFNLLPSLIYKMYSTMYSIKDLIVEYNMHYATIGMLSSMLCTVGATIIVITKDLKEVPAELMRPKAPKLGKRVLLEKITFIWSKLNFSKKVTIRNIFRYKKKFLMTIIGVMGCTSLILAGFGFKDSVAKIIPLQYDEIFKYNMQITFKDSATNKEIEQKKQEVLNIDNIENGIMINMESGKLVNNDISENVEIIAINKDEDISKYIAFRNKQTKKSYELDDDSIIITEKVANMLDIKQGDKVILTNNDDQSVEVTVSHITENYLLHYVYLTDELYNKLYGIYPQMNTLITINNDISIKQEETIGSDILKDNSIISSLIFTSSTKTTYNDVLSSLNYVVWILIISAGLLDFVVLYNLAYVNIGERIREIATIKVLGFYDKEVHSYIEKETMILAFIGIIMGIVAGYFLNIFIMTTCELDMLMFSKKILPQSYVFAVLITIIFTVIVSITTYFSLKKINMIEALKSIE